MFSSPQQLFLGVNLQIQVSIFSSFERWSGVMKLADEVGQSCSPKDHSWEQWEKVELLDLTT